MDGLDIDQTEALEEMLAGKNVFLSGTGGTGKSAVIRLFLENCRKNIVCMAPTGLAALNLPEAMTIHSFFNFPSQFQKFWLLFVYNSFFCIKTIFDASGAIFS